MTSERKGCVKGLVIVCAGILALSVGFVTTGEATSYTFVKIADSKDGYNQINRFPSLNNEGTVAFSTPSAILRGDGGAPVTVAETGGEFSSFGRPSIGDGDQVAFKAVRINDLGQFHAVVVRSNGATLTTIAGPESDPAFLIFHGVSINNSGRVAFLGVPFVGPPLAIFTGNGGALTQIAETDFSLPFVIPWGSTPVIDDRGNVVFQASNASGQGIFTGNGTPITTGFTTVLDPPSVSDSGIVAFQAKEGSQERIFKHDGGLTIVADTIDFAGVSFASVYNEGVVAFRGVPRSTRKTGIFTGPDPEKDKVIAVGDALFGLTVSDVGFSWEGLNNEGQVAFYARLADGTVGIYRADPMADEIPVMVDVKPGDNPNVINRDSHGVVPVAILSTESFDARDVDPKTITLANASVKVKKNGTMMVAFEDVNEDGLVDLLFHVSTQDLQLEESDSELVLEGQTLDKTLDATPVKVKGSDSVRVIH